MHFCLRCMLEECAVFVKYALHIGCCHYDMSLRLRVSGGVIIPGFNYGDSLLRGGTLAVARWGLQVSSIICCSVWEEKYVVGYFLCESRWGFYCDSTGGNDYPWAGTGNWGSACIVKKVLWFQVIAIIAVSVCCKYVCVWIIIQSLRGG